MIVYFTGTGNSRYCAQLLADRLEDRCLDAFYFIRDDIAVELISEKPWVFVMPTYSWQMPRVFAQLIRGGTFSGNQDAYFVMTCGGDIGSAGRNNEALCREKGLRYRGTLPVVMPDNYIVMFRPPERAEALSIVDAARPVLERGAADIAAGRDFPPMKPRLLDGLKSGIVNTLFYRFQIKSEAFSVSSACIGCGKCETVCPLGNIRLKEGKPIWGSRCTHCMACICLCPTEAIEYGGATRGKPRYQCPPYHK